MNIEEIRKNAPINAMFYAVNDGEVFYFKSIGGSWFLWVIDGWIIVNSLDVAAIANDLCQL